MILLRPKFLIILFVIFLAIHEGESRRKILKGRKAITRTYYTHTGLPSWVVVVLVALGELILGGLLYLLLKIQILDKPIKPRFHQILTAPPESGSL